MDIKKEIKTELPDLDEIKPLDIEQIFLEDTDYCGKYYDLHIKEEFHAKLNDKKDFLTDLSDKVDQRLHCNICDIEYSNRLATINHYVFTHPNSEDLQRLFELNGFTSSSNIIEIDKGALKNSKVSGKNKVPRFPLRFNNLKEKWNFKGKCSYTDNRVKIQDIQIPKSHWNSRHDRFTLRNLKEKPPTNIQIKVVKKADIKFDQMYLNALKNSST